MAKVILKWRYIKPGTKKHNSNLVKYIAQRHNVDKIDDTWQALPVSESQQNLIEQILKDFPEAADSHEYQDYLAMPTKGNASEFITRSIEDNFDRIGKRKNYVHYIAHRPGAERFGTHGLFTDANIPIDLNAVAEEVAEHKGILMTEVLSIRREDAVRLGFDKGEVWRDMLRSQTTAMAQAMNIPLEDLRWYAAFHNESHHPHCHIVAYSVGKKPYMSQQDLMKLKESFAHEIFKQDLLTTYQEQTSQRNLLKKETGDLVRSIIRSINTGTYENIHLESMLRELSSQLQKAKGKKVYGYLPQPARNLVNNIVDELAKDERLSQLYSLWYDQRDAVIRTYQDKMPERLPLSQNETFRSIKNTVIQEAMNLSADVPAMDTAVDLPDESAEEIPESVPVIEPEVFTPPAHADNEPSDEIPPQEDPAPSPKPPQQRANWWTDAYKQARRFLYGTKEEPPQLDKAYELLLSEAKAGNGLAMHDLGKMLLTGLGCEKDEVLAQSWFLQAHEAFLQMEKTDKHPYYWQYRIGKMYSYGYGVEQDYTASAEWFTKAIEGRSPFAAYALGGQYFRGQGVEQDFEKAFSLFTMAATDTSKPNAYAQYQLGRMCKEDLGTSADLSASEHWYRQAYQGFLRIEQDMADEKLYYRLGSMNLSGTGTDVDLIQAMLYFERAAELGNVDALYGLGKLYLRKDFEGYDPVKAAEYLEKAAKQEHSYAQYLLGKLLLRGEDIPQDLEAAIQWLEKSAEQDNQYAQYLLGKLLLRGDGVEADPKRAIELLERSVEQGNLYAAYTLGKAYLSGEVIPQDVARAIQLLTDAAQRDMDSAMYSLAKLYLVDELVPMDKETAIYWLKKAVALDNQYAQYQLGKMLLFGQGIDRDIEAGKYLLQCSAAQGNEYAQRILNNYGRTPIALASFRLMAHLAQIFQQNIREQEQKNSNIIDRKLRQKIEEKKQAQGLKMG